jgi:hypothetical protein
MPVLSTNFVDGLNKSVPLILLRKIRHPKASHHIKAAVHADLAEGSAAITIAGIEIMHMIRIASRGAILFAGGVGNLFLAAWLSRSGNLRRNREGPVRGVASMWASSRSRRAVAASTAAMQSSSTM